MRERLVLLSLALCAAVRGEENVLCAVDGRSLIGVERCERCTRHGRRRALEEGPVVQLWRHRRTLLLALLRAEELKRVVEWHVVHAAAAAADESRPTLLVGPELDRAELVRRAGLELRGRA